MGAAEVNLPCWTRPARVMARRPGTTRRFAWRRATWNAWSCTATGRLWNLQQCPCDQLQRETHRAFERHLGQTRRCNAARLCVSSCSNPAWGCGWCSCRDSARTSTLTRPSGAGPGRRQPGFQLYLADQVPGAARGSRTSWSGGQGRDCGTSNRRCSQRPAIKV